LIGREPDVSVVLPTFNRDYELKRAMDSVFSQTHSNFELIVVNDGSTDQTSALLDSINDPRLHVIRGSINRGANWARNQGILSARSGVITFLDSDDAYLENKIESVLALFRGYPELDLIVDSFCFLRDVEGGVEERMKINPDISEIGAFRAALFERRISKATTALSVRKAAAIDAGLFDEELRRRQDFEFVLRFSKSHDCIATSQVLWTKHAGRNSISTNPSTFLEATIEICKRNPEYLQQHSNFLYRDLRSHFSKLLRHREWATFLSDAVRYHRHSDFERSFWRLLLRSS